MVVSIPVGRLEKAWSHSAIGFDNRGYPRSVALRRPWHGLPQMGPKMVNNLPEFGVILHDESGGNLVSRLGKQGFDFFFQKVNFCRCHGHGPLPVSWPPIRTIECRGGGIGSQERN